MMCRIFAIMIFAFLVPVIAPSVAHAEQSIAIVDVDKVFAEAKAAKALQSHIKTKKEAFQKEFSAKEKELKAAETTLMAEQGKLPAEEFGKKRKAYEEKIIETQKLFKKRRADLDGGLAKAMQELRKSVVEAAAVVADEKKIDIVLTRESVLIAEKALDITSDVLTKLDAKVSDIPLKVE